MKSLLIGLTVLFAVSPAMGFEKEGSEAMFQEAFINSNADYNVNRKKILDQENERIDDWDNRDHEALTIEAPIDVEARDYEVSLND